LESHHFSFVGCRPGTRAISDRVPGPDVTILRYLGRSAVVGKPILGGSNTPPTTLPSSGPARRMSFRVQLVPIWAQPWAASLGERPASVRPCEPSQVLARHERAAARDGYGARCGCAAQHFPQALVGGEFVTLPLCRMHARELRESDDPMLLAEARAPFRPSEGSSAASLRLQC
jgi:hypothetical protein